MPTNPIDDLPRLRPEIGRRNGQIPVEKVPRFRSALLSRLGRQGLTGGATSHRSHAIRRAADVRAPASKSRRCIVKSRYVQMNDRGVKAARLHLAYIERDGVEQDGSPGRLYGSDDAFDRQQFVAELPKEKRQFRLIVSPEDAGSLDLKTFTRQLMEGVAADLGRKIIWAAVNHHDTDNPHVHVVVRGVDADGKDLRINGQYLSRGLRWRAQGLVTRELGPRSEVEQTQQQAAEIKRERFTATDRLIAEFATADRVVGVDTLSPLFRAQRAACLARLQTLEQLQLARKCARGKWVLAPSWEDSLRGLGTRADVVKRIHKAMRGSTAAGYQTIDPTKPFAAFDGVVRGQGLHDELSGTFFVVLETLQGEVKYLRLPDGVANTLHEGDVVRIGAEAESWTKPADRVVAAHASRHAGIYDPVLHLEQLERISGARRREGAPSPAELVTANQRRLERLEKYGLVEHLPDGRWRIPPDLLTALSDRATTHPRARLRIQPLGPTLPAQLSYLGPTWLDQQPANAPTRAAFGFGAELSQAARKREAYLQSIGVLPGSAADRLTALHVLERKALGNQVASKFQMAFEPNPPFSGRLLGIERLPSGAAYGRVVDDIGRRFTLVPMRPGYVEGQLLEVVSDYQGRITVRRPRISREK